MAQEPMALPICEPAHKFQPFVELFVGKEGPDPEPRANVEKPIPYVLTTPTEVKVANAISLHLLHPAEGGYKEQR